MHRNPMIKEKAIENALYWKLERHINQKNICQNSIGHMSLDRKSKYLSKN